MEDLFLITPEEWTILKVLPFHRNKIIHAAANTKQQKVEVMQKNFFSQNQLNRYKFESTGLYNASHVL